jgi:hypothetical protein
MTLQQQADAIIFRAMKSVEAPTNVERTVEDAQRFHLMPRRPLKVVCAWCHPGAVGPNITHGICPGCAEKMK